VGDDSTTSAGTHLTLPVASATGPLPLPPKAGGEGQGDGLLLANLMHFARTLRAAGLPVGPGKVIDAVQAVRTIGITNRRDFYWTLHAVFVNRPDQRLIFDQAFHVFWRNPDLLKKMMALVLPEMRVPGEEDRGAEMARRLAEALHPNRGEPAAEPEEVETEIDAIEGVLESAVFGVPHADFGEAVTAAVVPRPGATLSEAGILSALGCRLAKFKAPKQIVLVEALPRNAMGKVQKAALREAYKNIYRSL